MASGECGGASGGETDIVGQSSFGVHEDGIYVAAYTLLTPTLAFVEVVRCAMPCEQCDAFANPSDCLHPERICFV